MGPMDVWPKGSVYFEMYLKRSMCMYIGPAVGYCGYILVDIEGNLTKPLHPSPKLLRTPLKARSNFDRNVTCFCRHLLLFRNVLTLWVNT